MSLYRNWRELLEVAPQDILYLDDRAENVEAAARLGINSVLFDTVEKTASRVESRFDIPVPSCGRCRQSSSQYSSTNRLPVRLDSVLCSNTASNRIAGACPLSFLSSDVSS